MMGFTGSLVIAGITYLYYYYSQRRGEEVVEEQRREESTAPSSPPSTQSSHKRPSPRPPPSTQSSFPRGEESTAPRPPPSTQSSHKRPSPAENSRRKPTEVPKNSSSPFPFPTEPSSSSHVSREIPRYEIPEHPKEEPYLLGRGSSRNSSSPFLCPTEPSSSSHVSREIPRYEIPEHLEEEIKKDIVPSVLESPLNPLNYADYFAALLYAEDFYCEKWSDYLLSDVTLKLTSKESFFKVPNLTGTLKDNKNWMGKTKKDNKNWTGKTKKDNKNWTGEDFVEFEMDSVPEGRPYLLSRDYVRLQPSGQKVEPFQGVLFRVVKSKTVLAEFKDDFHRQHSPSKKYNVSFSFNRVCLKRSHQAISAAMNPLLSSILFPDPSSRIDSMNSTSNMFSSAQGTEYGPFQVIRRILNLKDPAPYLIEGPLSNALPGSLSSTGTVIKETIIQICRTSPHCRILVCAQRNQTCDALTRSLLEDIPNSEMFRANAAFRDYDLVPDDIIPQCSYEHECFTCPSLSELREFKIVTSTFISTFRLYAAGIAANHFTHIFLVDASSTTEPETVVALANLVSKKTVIVVTGSSEDMPFWVRSDIARRNGLKRSLFQRLLERHPYSMNDPRFISHVT